MKQLNLNRRTFIRGLGASVTLATGLHIVLPRNARALETPNPHLTRINRDLLISSAEVRTLHEKKDSMGGPTFAGTPSWKNFVELVERELRACGVVDIVRNPWKYSRWSTTEFSDESNWSLQVDGTKVAAMACGCYSGSTPQNGVTGNLVVYKKGMPAEALKGNIALVLKPSFEQFLQATEAGEFAKIRATGPLYQGDYEYLSNPETFRDPLQPMAEMAGVNPFPEMGLGVDLSALEQGGAAGAVIVLGLSRGALAGIYTFPVPKLHNVPSLYVDREIGNELVKLAPTIQRATLRLIAKINECETYQLFGYLPGKHYGTPADEQLLLITHTDGPSISQENGALGILGMVNYFSRLPQAERPRTLMIFLDCRHYMPGGEQAFAEQDYVKSHPDLYKKVVAAMGIEHLGQMQVSDNLPNGYNTTGLPEVSSLWISKNQHLVDIAVKAVKDNKLARVQIQCPDRRGSHSKPQGRQFGLGVIARTLGVPGASTMGLMSAYWSTKARLDYLDADHFVTQVATMSQICGELMVAELSEIKAS